MFLCCQLNELIAFHWRFWSLLLKFDVYSWIANVLDWILQLRAPAVLRLIVQVVGVNINPKVVWIAIASSSVDKNRLLAVQFASFVSNARINWKTITIDITDRILPLTVWPQFNTSRGHCHHREKLVHWFIFLLFFVPEFKNIEKEKDYN